MGLTPGPSDRDVGKLRGELWSLVRFFLFCGYVSLGSFRYKFEAATVPMIIGFSTLLLVALRLYHVVNPRSRIGQFKEAGLAGEFDQIKEEIEEEALKGRIGEAPAKEITFPEERKAFLALAFSCLSFVLLGYVVGSLTVVLGTTIYYGYTRPVPILVTCAAVFFLLYVVLHRLFGADISWGLLLGPILDSLGLT
jgi:hypothetical protein